MDIQTSVKTVLTEKYATFTGRASRSEDWWFTLFLSLVSVVLQLVWVPLYLVFMLAVLCPALAVGWRRLQDTGRPGWYILIPFGLSVLSTLLTPTMPTEEAMMAGEVPGMGSVLLAGVLGIVSLVVFLLFLWWLTRPSQPGPNEYGPPPAA